MENEVQIRNRVEELSQSGYEIDLGKYISSSWKTVSADFFGYGLLCFVQVLVTLLAACTIVGLVCVPALSVGFMYIAHKVKKGEPYTTGDLFLGFKNFGNIFTYSLIYGGLILLFMIPFIAGEGLFIYGSSENESSLMISGGVLLALGIPLMLVGIYYFQTSFFFSHYLILFGNYSATEAIRASRKLASKNFWYVLLFLFVSALLGNIGVYACYIGMFVSIPFMLFMQHDMIYDLLETDTSTDDKISKHLVS